MTQESSTVFKELAKLQASYKSEKELRLKYVRLFENMIQSEIYDNILSNFKDELMNKTMREEMDARRKFGNDRSESVSES